MIDYLTLHSSLSSSTTHPFTPPLLHLLTVLISVSQVNNLIHPAIVSLFIYSPILHPLSSILHFALFLPVLTHSAVFRLLNPFSSTLHFALFLPVLTHSAVFRLLTPLLIHPPSCPLPFSPDSLLLFLYTIPSHLQSLPLVFLLFLTVPTYLIHTREL